MHHDVKNGAVRVNSSSLIMHGILSTTLSQQASMNLSVSGHARTLRCLCQLGLFSVRLSLRLCQFPCTLLSHCLSCMLRTRHWFAMMRLQSCVCKHVSCTHTCTQCTWCIMVQLVLSHLRGCIGLRQVPCILPFPSVICMAQPACVVRSAGMELY